MKDLSKFFPVTEKIVERRRNRPAPTKKRTIIVRSVIGVIYVLLLVLMFVTGRSHTVLIDNRAAEDGSFDAIKAMTVTVGHNAPSDFMKGDRDKFTVKGQKLKIKVESFDGKIDETYTLHIPLKEDTVIVSIPRLAKGIDGAMEKFELN